MMHKDYISQIAEKYVILIFFKMLFQNFNSVNLRKKTFVRLKVHKPIETLSYDKNKPN